MKKRTIAIFTGNRAEYGLQYPIIKAISDNPNLDYQLLVSGAHLDRNFGGTLEEIKGDGFEIAAQVKIQTQFGRKSSTSCAIGSGVLAIAETLERLKPDILVVYADRFEGFAAVIAATQMNIPTAHIEGGDLTEGGALDDSVRHAMTKLAHLHFTTNLQASQRILAMGEEDWRVHTVGLPAIDLILSGDFAAPEEISEKLNLTLARPIVLFTQHSITTEHHNVESQIRSSLDAMKVLANEGCQVVVTYPNNDAGSDLIIKEIQLLKKQNIDGVTIFPSLGRHMYHGVLALAKNPHCRVACVGNSSSGIKETPVFGCPTVNIGSRQAGRLRGDNVIDCDYDSLSIYRAVSKCLFSEEFRGIAFGTRNPYFMGGAGKKISSILQTTPIDQYLLRKKMTIRDLNSPESGLGY